MWSCSEATARTGRRDAQAGRKAREAVRFAPRARVRHALAGAGRRVRPRAPR